MGHPCGALVDRQGPRAAPPVRSRDSHHLLPKCVQAECVQLARWLPRPPAPTGDVGRVFGAGALLSAWSRMVQRAEAVERAPNGSSSSG